MVRKAGKMSFDDRFKNPVLKADVETYRCPYCNQILFKGDLPQGTTIEIMCGRYRCKRTVVLGTI